MQKMVIDFEIISNKFLRGNLLLTSNNFYENPHRILQSTLPPLVAATSISGGGRKRNLTRNRKHKNKNKKIRKYTRRN